QQGTLTFGEWAARAARQAPQPHRAEPRANEPVDTETEVLADAPHLAVPPFAKREFEVPMAVPGWRRANVTGLHRPVFQHDASPQRAHRRSDVTTDGGDVRALNTGAWVGQPVRGL